MTGDAFDGFKYTRLRIRKLSITGALKLDFVSDDKYVNSIRFNLLNVINGKYELNIIIIL